jgi:malonyl CoA-acyl carrier protein transacylase
LQLTQNLIVLLTKQLNNCVTFVFPVGGAQFNGMGKDLYENSAEAKALFDKADEILGFKVPNHV